MDGEEKRRSMESLCDEVIRKSSVTLNNHNHNNKLFLKSQSSRELLREKDNNKDSSLKDEKDASLILDDSVNNSVLCESENNAGGLIGGCWEGGSASADFHQRSLDSGISSISKNSSGEEDADSRLSTCYVEIAEEEEEEEEEEILSRSCDSEEDGRASNELLSQINDTSSVMDDGESSYPSSPSTHSVKSLPAMVLLTTVTPVSSPNDKKVPTTVQSSSSISSKSSSHSVTSSGRLLGLRTKKSLTALFDAVVTGRGGVRDSPSKIADRRHKSDQNLISAVQVTPSSAALRPPPHPRAKSAGEKDKRWPAKKQQQQQQQQQKLQLPPVAVATSSSSINSSKLSTRLATSDLRTLELRERMCQSSEALDGSRIVKEVESNNNVNNNNSNNNAKKSPRHPQGYYTVDPRRRPNASVGDGICNTSSTLRKKIGGVNSNSNDERLLRGIKQFNLDPKRGLSILVECGFLPPYDKGEEEGDEMAEVRRGKAARATALFLFREARLSKRMIGRFIGSEGAFNQEVLREFVRCHEFTHLILVQALRQFLWSFRLPGEAQQIDRIMEAFARHYCDQNPNLFEVTDTCYILSFSVIMLNTMLHNPNVKQKISVEQFVKQNRGINSGKDLPKDILELIYRSIKEEPFKIPDETYDDLMYTFFSPVKEGWLLKQGGSWKTWKKRSFVLSDRCLYYFQHTAENVPKGIIPLDNVEVRIIDDVDGKQFCFEVYSESNAVVKGCKTDSKGTVVQGNHKSYRMSASSEDDRSDWVQSITASICIDPGQSFITAKKMALRRKQLQQLGSNKPNCPDSPAAASTGSFSTPKRLMALASRERMMKLTPKKLNLQSQTTTPKKSEVVEEVIATSAMVAV